MPIEKTPEKLLPLEIRVLKTIREHAMLAAGERVVVAVSGGADSTALLLCLHALNPGLGCDFTVAHLNHRLRGREGDEDEAFVRRMSAGLGLPCETASIDVFGQAASAKENLEQAARDKRYDFLRGVAGKVGAQKIAVGHNRNDQAETALFRFLRGSGIEGLSAIHPVAGGRIVRPMLDCSRDAILVYLNRRGCAYREDSSNRDLRYSRNRIRLELIPYLEKHFNPNLARTLAREALLMRETWALLRSQAEEAFGAMACPVQDGTSMKTDAVAALHPALQKLVLRCALRQCLGSLRGVSQVHIEALLALCRNSQSGGRIHLPHGASATRQFNDLLLMRGAPEKSPAYSYELEIPGRCRVAEAGAALRAEILHSPKLMEGMDSRYQAMLEPAALQNPLTVRSRLAGDRYGGARCRKVKKMLIDAKIPLNRRHSLPMLASGPDVIWIPGFRPAAAYKAGNSSETFVMITFEQDTGRL